MRENHTPVIYLDHAATTPVDPEVFEAMLPFLKERFGNPSSLYHPGRVAREAIENSREILADFAGCRPTEVVFTSGGTEADNLAIKGVAWAYREKGQHLITSAVEHHAVLRACQFLEQHGFEVTYLPVDRYGRVDPERVRSAIRRDTILISVMHANNEVGTIEPVEQIGAIAKEHGILFHTDAVQSFGQIPTRMDEIQCDLLSISAHKIYGPKGVGALCVRRGCRLLPLIDGGGQEKNRRSGTENVAGIVGLGKAVDVARREMESDSLAQVCQLRDYLTQEIQRRIPGVRVNGHPQERLPNNLSCSVRDADGESLLLSLDVQNICASSGSACSTGSLEPSHVLAAMGVPRDYARGTIRFSLGKNTTREEIDTVLDVFPSIVEHLRSLSVVGKSVAPARRSLMNGVSYGQRS